MAAIDHPVLFLLFAVALWCGAGLALAYVSGWRTLANYYRATQPFGGRRWQFASASMRLVAYHNCLSLGADARGVFIAIWFPFRLAHPPLFIPWSEIDGVERCQSVRHMVGFCFRRAPSLAFKTSLDLTMALMRESHGRLLPPGATTLLDEGTRLGETPR